MAALTTSKIVGTILLPDGTVLSDSYVNFQLDGFDTDAADDVTVPQVAVRAYLDPVGALDVDLWPNERGARDTLYSVRIGAAVDGVVTEYSVGKILVPAVGPTDINDLLPLIPPAGVTVDQYLAQLSAAVASATASADSAAADATISVDNAVSAANSAASAAASAASVAAMFDTVDDLLADATLDYTSVSAGDRMRAGSLLYEVADTAAVDNHEVTAGGVKLYEAGLRFTTLTRLQDAVARGVVWRDGDLVSADGIVYVVNAASTAIAGLNGFDYHVPANAVHATTAGNADNATTLAGQLASYFTNASNLNAGTVADARLNIGTAAGQLVALDAAAKLPAVDGSQLTNLAVSSGLPPPDYTATATTWTNSTAVTLVHGMADTPKIVLVWYVCAVADGGWSVGDRIPVDFDQSAFRGCHVGFNGTNIILGPLASYPRSLDNTSYLTLTATNWNIEVSAWL